MPLSHRSTTRPGNRDARHASERFGGLRRWSIGIASLTLAATSAVAIHNVDSVQAAGVVHVAPHGSDSSNGSAGAPLRTVARAVKIAAPGDTVLIASGTYHESVQVYSKEVHLAAAPGANVIFDGASVVSTWTPSGGAWSTPWQTDFARASQPHTLASAPEAGWPELFFIDGVELTEVTNRSAVGAGTFFNDTVANLVWIGDNPAGRLVEGSDLAWAIYLNHADGSSVTGVTARRYATPTSNMAAIRAYADNLVLTDVTVEHNSYMGVSAMGTNISIAGLTSRGNGHLGAHGHRLTNLSVSNSVIADNNAKGFDPRHAAGGIKVTESKGVIVSDSTVVDNGGPGIWTDLDTTAVTVANNLVTGNSRSGIEIELSQDATIIGNAVANNGEAGIWVLESSNVRVWHNASFNNVRDIWIEDGPRADLVNVDVVNNTLGGGAAGAPAILNVDDWTGQRSAEAMNVTLSNNRYWMPPGSQTPYLSRWANWPYPLELTVTIEQHQSVTGQDAGAALSTADTNPYVRLTAEGDYRQPSGAVTGAALSPTLATQAGVAPASYPAGPLNRVGQQPTTPATPPVAVVTTVATVTTPLTGAATGSATATARATVVSPTVAAAAPTPASASTTAPADAAVEAESPAVVIVAPDTTVAPAPATPSAEGPASVQTTTQPLLRSADESADESTATHGDLIRGWQGLAGAADGRS